MFDDHNISGSRVEKIVRDIRSRGFDSLMWANGSLDEEDQSLAVTDRLGFDVFLGPASELNTRWWWKSSGPSTIQEARRVGYPLVDRLKRHPSLRGYYIVDEPGLDLIDKVRLMIQAFRERDAARPIFPVLIGLDRADPIVDAARPDVMLIDVYPIGEHNAPCDFTMSGFGYSDRDFVGYVREVAREKPAATPLWMILQTHGLAAVGLRQPLIEEVRKQFWLAVGEGAQGIFWFIYTSQQGWVGLEDNPSLYDEVTSLAGRTAVLRDSLTGARKVADRFGATGNAYVSTLVGQGNRLYAVIANQACGARIVSITAGTPGSLRDVESNRTYALGETFELSGGDGRLFEFTPTPGGAVYLSDLGWTAADNGWGPLERDMSNGELDPGDGGPLSLNGVRYSRGLGAHARSEVKVPLDGLYARFQAEIGIDDEVPTGGSVVFQVWADRVKLYDSGRMTASSPTKRVDVAVAGRSELRLVVTDGGDGIANDHGDSADARLTTLTRPPAPVPTATRTPSPTRIPTADTGADTDPHADRHPGDRTLSVGRDRPSRPCKFRRTTARIPSAPDLDRESSRMRQCSGGVPTRRTGAGSGRSIAIGCTTGRSPRSSWWRSCSRWWLSRRPRTPLRLLPTGTATPVLTQRPRTRRGRRRSPGRAPRPPRRFRLPRWPPARGPQRPRRRARRRRPRRRRRRRPAAPRPRRPRRRPRRRRPQRPASAG